MERPYSEKDKNLEDISLRQQSSVCQSDGCHLVLSLIPCVFIVLSHLRADQQYGYNWEH